VNQVDDGGLVFFIQIINESFKLLWFVNAPEPESVPAEIRSNTRRSKPEPEAVVIIRMYSTQEGAETGNTDRLKKAGVQVEWPAAVNVRIPLFSLSSSYH